MIEISFQVGMVRNMHFIGKLITVLSLKLLISMLESISSVLPRVLDVLCNQSSVVHIWSVLYITFEYIIRSTSKQEYHEAQLSMELIYFRLAS